MNFDNLQVFFLNSDVLTQVIFISCKPPVDPVELVIKYIKTVETTGITRTRSMSPFSHFHTSSFKFLIQFSSDILIV